MIEKRNTNTGIRYEVRLRGPDDLERSRTFRTRRDAERYERDQRSALDRGNWIDPRGSLITFEDYARKWLRQRSDLRPRTVELYESLLRNHLNPRFGSTPLKKITPSAVRAWYGEMVRIRAVTAAKAYRLLKGVLSTTVTDEVIGRNPCMIKGAAQERSPERPMVSIAETDALAAAMPEQWRIAVELAAWCHLSVGEILGLERRDIDLLHRTVRIDRTAFDVGGRLHLGPPKTEAGKRTVSVPPHVCVNLERHLDTYVSSEPDAPLLTGLKGGRPGRHPLHTAWCAARASIGRPEVHFHDLRGAGLTWAATQGATTRELMARAGHASPAAALRYQYAVADRDVAIAKALSGLAEASRAANPAGYSRDDIEDVDDVPSNVVPLNSGSDESGRPGSNRHDQLGRLRFYH